MIYNKQNMKCCARTCSSDVGRGIYIHFVFTNRINIMVTSNYRTQVRFPGRKAARQRRKKRWFIGVNETRAGQSPDPRLSTCCAIYPMYTQCVQRPGTGATASRRDILFGWRVVGSKRKSVTRGEIRLS